MIGRQAVLNAFPPSGDANVFASLPLTRIDLRHETTLALFIETLVQDLGQESPSLCEPESLPHVERLLLMLLAKSLHCGTYRPNRRETSAIAPYYVRRAEDHIMRNYAQKIRIEDLARISGVSVRTLHYGFAKFRDHSPLEHLRATRLAHARRDLIEARASGFRVSDIAGRVGYANNSQFSRDYKEYFGESPTDTVKACGD
jgi:AraC-like DNA-binding protein